MVYAVCRRGPVFFAELTEQNHQICEAAVRDMCEATVVSAGLRLSWVGMEWAGVYQPR